MRPNFACAPDGEAPLLRHLPWPKLLDFWDLPNVRVINRDVHVVKSADGRRRTDNLRAHYR